MSQTMKTILRRTLLSFGVVAASLAVDAWVPGGFLSHTAEAVIGRPATPGSVAGVARRTTRRRYRRTAIYVSSLPPACTPVVIDGTTLQNCGGKYYQPVGSQYEVVVLE
jgi:hypothetical protein